MNFILKLKRWSQWSHDPYVSCLSHLHGTVHCGDGYSLALHAATVTSCVALAECVIMEAKSLYGADLIFESPYKSDLISFINTHSHTHAEMESKMQKKNKNKNNTTLARSTAPRFQSRSAGTSRQSLSPQKKQLLSSPSSNTAQRSVWVTLPQDSVAKVILPWGQRLQTQAFPFPHIIHKISRQS